MLKHIYSFLIHAWISVVFAFETRGNMRGISHSNNLDVLINMFFRVIVYSMNTVQNCSALGLINCASDFSKDAHVTQFCVLLLELVFMWMCVSLHVKHGKLKNSNVEFCFITSPWINVDTRSEMSWGLSKQFSNSFRVYHSA